MMPSPARRALALLALTAVPLLVMGCPKKAPPVEAVVDASPAAPPASTVTELAPLTDDGGPDADAAPEAGPKKWKGGGDATANQLKIKACCNSMRAQAKALGNSPEANQINALAVTCDALVSQVGPNGNAPEFNQLRAILKVVKLPNACQL